jgi:hypothetical protein
LFFLRILNWLKVKPSDSSEVRVLKGKASELIDDKFLLAPQHYIAVVLNPKLKTLKMLDDSRKHQVYDTLRTTISQLTVPEESSELSGMSFNR